MTTFSTVVSQFQKLSIDLDKPGRKGPLSDFLQTLPDNAISALAALMYSGRDKQPDEQLNVVDYCDKDLFPTMNCEPKRDYIVDDVLLGKARVAENIRKGVAILNSNGILLDDLPAKIRY